VKVPIKVSYQDGAVKRLVATARDAVEFERRYEMSFARIWGVPEVKDKQGQVTSPAVPPREEWWYYLAWSALRRTGEDTRDFENFVNAIEGVTFDDEDETADVEGPDAAPFQKAPSDEESHVSPPQE
jgi:hypothetical protein